MTTTPRVVLVSPKHAGNVGSVARAMKNFGLAELWLVAPRCRIDREAHALAAHAHDVLEASVEVATLDEALADTTMVIGTSARPRASEVHRADVPERVLGALTGQRGALVFGPEDTGLDNAALDRCRLIATIPTAPYASLNLAQAVVVVAYLWHREAHAEGSPLGGNPASAVRDGAPMALPSTAAALAPREQVEGMYDQLESVALRSGYTDERRLASALRHLRAVFDRASPSADEVARLRGLWRHLAWALEQPPERLPGRDAGIGRASDWEGGGERPPDP
ncbi:MAG: TrmJ/YjtD family RNA methyltransferase [Trueperaceae bacterium]|nr:TrmJ/YjtD family RNA methyltransferase [Trueperaceae bacterium]